MSHNDKLQVEKEIMTAIDLCGSEGASVDDIRRHLKSTLKNNVPNLESIQSGLNNAVTNDLLLKLDNGKYKIKVSSKRAESTAEDTNMTDKVLSKLHRESNEIKKTARPAKENAKEEEHSVDKVAQDANRKADSDTKNVDTSMSMTKEDADVSFPDDEERVLSKLHKLPLKDNETKATGRHAEENAQEVKRSVGKVAEDANQNADSDKGKEVSSVTEKDANIPLPDDDDKTDKEKLIKGLKKDK